MLRSVWQVILVTGILAAVSVPDCAAQGLKISTQVFDASKPDSDRRGQLISSSLTLCHNGRVYDYVASADELVIYDPVLRQFTVLNRTRGLFTVVTFEEIRHHMETRTRKTQEYLAELVARGEPGAEAEADAINAQMQPDFKETWDPMRGSLTLASAWINYRVETRKWEDQQQVERYLVWRDWTARLNSVLHPQTLFPEPRLAVNEAVRRQPGRMPVVVEMDLRPTSTTRLRAEHQLTVGLTADDQDRIARWEKLAKSDEMQNVPLRRYQQESFLSRSR
ncbi:MAG: hypothetical protein ACKOEO_04970 [Planctomycetaceae bacterium]